MESSTHSHTVSKISKWLFFRSLAVGKKSGYKLFSLSSVEKLDQIYDNGMCKYFIHV